MQNTIKYSCHLVASFLRKFGITCSDKCYLRQGGAQAGDNSTRDTLSQDGIGFQQSLVKLKKVLDCPI